MAEPTGFSPNLPADEDVFVFPASFAQQRLWFLDQLNPGQDTYNAPVAFRFTGPLNIQALEKALAGVIDRHEALRTTFGSEAGEPVQIIGGAGEPDITYVNLRSVPPSERETRMRALVTEEVRRPFDLATGPLLRTTVLQLTDDEHIVVFNSHHIVNDDWSVGVFLRDLKAFYEAAITNQLAALPELPIQYADFAVWQRDWVKGEPLERQMGYWREQLAGAPALELPTDGTRQGVSSRRGGMETFSVPGALLGQLKELSKREGATLFMTLLAAFKVLLFRYSAQTDIVLGSPISNRSRAEIEPLIGFFVNTLVLRTSLDGQPTFREVLARVRTTVLGGFEHQDAPFEMLVEKLQPERRLNQNPFCQAMFVLVTSRPTTPPIADLAIEPIEIEDTTVKFDLTLTMIDVGEGISGVINYDADLFQASTIRQLHSQFLTLLQAVVAQPEALIANLPLLTEDERKRAIVVWNQTAREYPGETGLAPLFEQQVRRAPKAVAMVSGSETWTYRELNRGANRLAHRLQSLGVVRGASVGVCLERSMEMVMSMLAILKAGGVYVPVDPDYPAERIRLMLADSGAGVVIARKGAEGWPGQILLMDRETFTGEDDRNLPSSVAGDDLAYVIYTSGSTGTPKGVCVTQRGVSRLVLNTDYAPLSAADVVAHLSNVSFDAATFEIWGALLNGGRLVIWPKEVVLSATEFARRVKADGVTAMFLTSALFTLLAQEKPEAFAPLRYLIVGGDKVDPGSARAVLETGPPEHLINGYGPTEATTFAICGRIENVSRETERVPLGRPIANTTAYVLDARMEPVPIGVRGELYLGGPGLARGYLNAPELTAQRFVSNPFGSELGARLYKTGDLARYLADGRIEFLGRMDDQVKIRGFRLELGEIESALRTHPAVRDCAVLLRQDPEKNVVAYVVAPGISAEELQKFVRSKLPEFACPSAILVLDAFPLTKNGKLDRHALPAPAAQFAHESRVLMEPRDQLELKLLKIWENALQRHPIGIHDDFFALGGHSLLAVRIFSQIERQMGRNLPLATLFTSPTIERLANVLRREDDTNAWASLVPIQPHGTRPPFFCLHGGDGGVIFHSELANSLDRDIPIFGLQAQGLDGGRIEDKTVEQLAASYIREIKSVQPSGPYHFGGYSFGGVIAFEMARELQAGGEEVGLVVLFDTVNPINLPRRYRLEERVAHRRREIIHLSLAARLKYLFGRMVGKIIANYNRYYEVGEMVLCRLQTAVIGKVPVRYRNLEVRQAHLRAMRIFQPKPFAGRLTLFRATDRADGFEFDPKFGWEGFATEIDVQDISGSHATLFKQPHVHQMAGHLNERLRAAHRRIGGGPAE